MAYPKTCASCGCRMTMAQQVGTGTWIPLQDVATVPVEKVPDLRNFYVLDRGPSPAAKAEKIARTDSLRATGKVYVSHFETCDNPDRFKGGDSQRRPKPKRAQRRRTMVEREGRVGRWR